MNVNIKSILTLACVAALALTGPSCKKEAPAADEAANQAALAEASREELTQALTERDQLLDLVNSINDDMTQLKEMEGILSAPGLQSEGPQRKRQIQDDIVTIRETLKQRRQQLADLEAKLRKSNLTNSNLLKTVERLRAQITQQEQLIETLRGDLEKAGTRIAELDAKVDTLNTTVSNVTTERNEAQAQAAERERQLNTVYYVFASKSELKAHNIITGGGFLRSTKLNPSEYGSSFFTHADKRTLTRINLMSSKAKVLTAQPKDSYRLEKVNGQYQLDITNPEAFWRPSPYLVIQVD